MKIDDLVLPLQIYMTVATSPLALPHLLLLFL
jgi:hypothetical protein